MAGLTSSGAMDSGGPPGLFHRYPPSSGRVAPGVAEDGGGRRKVFAQLPRVHVDVDDRQARRDRFGAAAQRQVTIRALRHQEVMAASALRMAPPMGRWFELKRVESGNRGRFRQVLRVHRRAEHFGETDHLVMGIALGNRIAGEDLRRTRCGDEARRLLQGHLVGPDTSGDSVGRPTPLARIVNSPKGSTGYGPRGGARAVVRPDAARGRSAS